MEPYRSLPSSSMVGGEMLLYLLSRLLHFGHNLSAYDSLGSD